MSKYPKHIYCIEGNWYDHPNSKQTILPILELLNTFSDIKYIHCRCESKADFFYYLERFTKGYYKNYKILYIAFHGRANRIRIGKEFVTLKEIANVLKGKLTDKIVHFGSCSTLRTTEKNISDFITRTNCKHLSGYTKDVKHIDAAAFELLYFNTLQQRKYKFDVDSINTPIPTIFIQRYATKSRI